MKDRYAEWYSGAFRLGKICFGLSARYYQFKLGLMIQWDGLLHLDLGFLTLEVSKFVEEETVDICGFCGQPGADKIPHPIRWPNEACAGTTYVHSACEDEECRRAHNQLSDKERADFIRSI